MRVAVLHVGFEKTGSKAIQKALEHYDDGTTIYAPLLDPNHSVVFRTIFERDNYFLHWKHLDKSRADVDALASEYQLQLEAILGLDRTRIVFSGETISDLEEYSLQQVRAFFERRNFSVEVIVCVREPMGWTASLIQEQIKHAYFPNDYIDLGLPVPTNLAHRMEALFFVFGNENVRIIYYEDVCKNGLELYFASIMRLKKILIPGETRENESLSGTASKLLLRFYRSGITHNVGSMLYRVRWNFIHHLSFMFPRTEEDKIDTDAILSLVNWDDYAALNHLLDRPYDLTRRHEERNRDFREYCNEIDTQRVASVLRTEIRSVGAQPPEDTSIEQLLALFFYKIMREDAMENEGNSL